MWFQRLSGETAVEFDGSGKEIIEDDDLVEGIRNITSGQGEMIKTEVVREQ